MAGPAEAYASEVRERIFRGVIGLIASQEHPQGISAKAVSLSFYASLDALVMVAAELLAEAGDRHNLDTRTHLVILQAALATHFERAVVSLGAPPPSSIN